jgi:hypothetical protein
MSGHSIENPFAPVFKISITVALLLLAACLSFFISPMTVFLPIAGAVLLLLAFNRPTSTLGLVLAFMPLDFMFIALGKFLGFPHMTLVSILDKEAILLLLAFILWRKNGFRPVAPDWFLLACLALATVRTAFQGTWVSLFTDLVFIVPYIVGRVTVLTAERQRLWAKCAVWIAGLLAVLGLIEVFVLGEGPRTVLYLAIDSETEGGRLTASFHATGFAGLREAATMVGPNGFGALCMVALILWWVYSRNPLPAGLVVVGLICSVTRSAWLGTALAIPFLAFVMGQRKRLLTYAALAVALFAVSIPILGLRDYLSATKTEQDSSLDWHRAGIVDGVAYAANHPLGSGNRRIGPAAYRDDSNALVFETTCPALAAEYGILTALCFVGFLVTAIHRIWPQKSLLAYASLGILVGIIVVMIFAIPIVDRRLNCWVWFPIGMAIQSSTKRDTAAAISSEGRIGKPLIGTI